MPHVYVIVSRIFDSYTRSYILMRKQCIIPHEQQIGRHLHKDLSLDEKTRTHVYVIVSRIYGRLFLYLINSKSDATYPRTYLLMRKQCLIFMLLSAASAANYLYLYLTNSKSDATYPRTYLLMRKQCRMFMLLLAASERAEINPLKIKFRKDIVEVVQTYCLGRAPTNFHVAECQSFVE